jgi:hypothetical protein
MCHPRFSLVTPVQAGIQAIFPRRGTLHVPDRAAGAMISVAHPERSVGWVWEDDVETPRRMSQPGRPSIRGFDLRDLELRGEKQMAWKFAVPMAVMLLISNLMAQSTEMADTNKASTKIGQFMSGSSVLTESQRFKLGKIGGTGKVELYAIKAYYPGRGDTDTLRGISFEVTETGETVTLTALLDIDEIRDLLEALKYMAEMTLNRPNNAENDFERAVSFTSRDGLKVGYERTGSFIGNGFCRVGKSVHSIMWMTEENYEKMISMINDGLVILGKK